MMSHNRRQADRRVFSADCNDRSKLCKDSVHNIRLLQKIQPPHIIYFVVSKSESVPFRKETTSKRGPLSLS